MPFSIQINQSDLQNIKKKTRKLVFDTGSKFVRKLAFEVYAEAVRRSIVDTGRMRGSWTISIGSPDVAHLPEESNGPFAPPSFSQAQANVRGYTLGKDVFVNNSLRYTIYHETGTGGRRLNPMAQPAVNRVVEFANSLGDITGIS